jgi:preprotein translocase subunit SecG
MKKKVAIISSLFFVSTIMAQQANSKQKESTTQKKEIKKTDKQKVKKVPANNIPEKKKK